MSVTLRSLGGPGTSEGNSEKCQTAQCAEGTEVLFRDGQTHTKDNDSDVDVLLSRLVLGCDGVASRVTPQTDRDAHHRCSVSGLNLETHRQVSRPAAKANIQHLCRTRLYLRVDGQCV